MKEIRPRLHSDSIIIRLLRVWGSFNKLALRPVRSIRSGKAAKNANGGVAVLSPSLSVLCE